MSKQFWRDKNVFITGHTGFKGSWLSLWLSRMGANLHGYSLAPPSTPHMFELAQLENCMHTHGSGDVRDLAALQRAMSAAEPDIIFHMAAQPLVRDSYDLPVETYSTNVMGTVHLLEAARTIPSVRAIVIVTSDKCYENRESPWGYHEDHPMGGHDPYSSSKGAAELITAAYRRSFFSGSASPTAVASARAGNVIGGGDFANDRLIPDFVRALSNNQSMTLRNPNTVRPWQFVLEPLQGYLNLAERLYEAGQAYAEGWNFGPSETDTQTVAQLCTTFSHALQQYEFGDIDINIATNASAPHEAAQLRLDISKARQRLEWIPKLELYTALELTANWYATYLRNGNLRTLSDAQIELYEQWA